METAIVAAWKEFARLLQQEIGEMQGHRLLCSWALERVPGIIEHVLEGKVSSSEMKVVSSILAENIWCNAGVV